MSEDLQDGWQQQLDQERYEITVQALRRCKAAGADEDDLRTLARECGIDPKYINVGESRAQN